MFAAVSKIVVGAVSVTVESGDALTELIFGPISDKLSEQYANGADAPKNKNGCAKSGLPDLQFAEGVVLTGEQVCADGKFLEPKMDALAGFLM